MKSRRFSSLCRTSRRWLRSRLQRGYEWQLSPSYWTLLRRWEALRFSAGRFLFGAGSWFRSRRESGTILSSILHTVCGQVVIAIAVVAGLEVLERVLLAYGGEIGRLLHMSPTFHRVRLALNHHPIEPATHVSILSTLAQIAGVFLGLYFTAVSVVASAAYARVRGDIRELLMREKVGNAYIRLVALLGAVAIFQHAALTIGFHTGILNLALLTGLGAMALFGFVVLGIRAFYFFDPAQLVEHLAVDLMRWIRSATPAGFQWRKPSFQVHYQRQADLALTTYRDVVSLSNAEEHLQGESLNRLALRALGLLRFYAREKQRIPSDSHWFERTHRHREWLTTDFTQISIALRTGTTLQPEIVPDPMWFEAQAEEIVNRTMRGLLERNDLRNAVALCAAVQRTLEALAEQLAIDEALSLFRVLGSPIRAVARKDGGATGGAEDGTTSLSGALALTDIYDMGLISILLGFSKRLHGITAESFGDTIGRIRWSRAKAIYATGLPRAVIEQLEYLQKGVNFEHALEGRTISPLWYHQQIAALGFVRFLATGVEKLVRELERVIADEAEALIAEKRYVFGAQVIQRGLEACAKFPYHVAEVQSCVERLSRLRRVADIPWPSVDWTKLNRRIDAVRERLIIGVAQSLASLPPLPASKHRPDYFGQGYSVLAEECYQAMATGRDKLFEAIFPSLFLAGLAAYDRLRKQLQDRDAKTMLVFSTEPIVDILELSGYALIYTELDGKGYARIAEGLWDRYLTRASHPQALSQFISAVVDYRRSLFAILPRDTARMAWKQDFIRHLEEQGWLQERAFRAPFPGDDSGRRHPSPLIRAVSRGADSSWGAEDVFFVAYLMKRPEAAGLPLPQRTELFDRMIRREQSTETPSDEGEP